jgi:Tol biopolymer transport system component
VRSNTHPAPVSISGDGRFIAFSSYERLLPADDDSLADIYVLERATGAVTLESGGAESPFNTDCVYPRISGDGRYLVFEASVSSTNGETAFVEVMFRDRHTDLTKRIVRSESGANANGSSGAAAVSDDGATVVFESTATNLVPGVDANGARPDIYQVKPATGRIDRISVDGDGHQSAAGSSLAPSLSADGRYIAFVSSAALLKDAAVASRPSTLPERHQIYIRDTHANLTTRINASAKGATPSDSCLRPAISRDGAYVAFVSSATNLVGSDQNRSPDVFLYERGSGSTTLVSRNKSGRPANGASGNPSISGDGRFVAFQSEASDLVCSRRCPSSAEDFNLLSDVFLFDRLAGVVALVSAGRTGGWMEESGAPAIDGTGRVIAFASRHPIDVGDIAHDFDLFVRIPETR